MAKDFVSVTRLQTFWTSLKTWLSNNYVPTYRRVNGNQLTGDIILDAADVEALPLAGGTMTGELKSSANIVLTNRYTSFTHTSTNKYEGSTYGWADHLLKAVDVDGNVFARVSVYGSGNDLAYMYMGSDDYKGDANLRVYPDGLIQGKNIKSIGLLQANIYTFYNTLNVFTETACNEIVIKTKIPFDVAGNYSINLKGYHYNEAVPIDLQIGFTDIVLSSVRQFFAYGAVTKTGYGDGVSIYLSTYTEDDVSYIAISLKKTTYIWLKAKFTIDLIQSTGTLSYAQGWTYQQENTTSSEVESIIPQDNIVTVPYKPIATDITGNAATASKTNHALTLKANGTAKGTFNGSADVSFDVTKDDIGLETGTETESGITKLYADTGSNTDGTITQKVITDILTQKADTTAVPTKTSQLTNDSGYITKATALSTTVTLGTSWSGSSAPYTQAVTVSGILATDTPILDVITSTSNYEAEETAWSNIIKAVTAANTITFYAKEKTETSLSIQVKVVR